MHQKVYNINKSFWEFYKSVKSVIKKTKYKMDYKVWKFLNGIILEDNLKYRIIRLCKNRGQNTFCLFFRKDFNHFI